MSSSPSSTGLGTLAEDKEAEESWESCKERQQKKKQKNMIVRSLFFVCFFPCAESEYPNKQKHNYKPDTYQ